MAESLRDEGISTLVHAGSGSFKSQFKRADASGAQIAVILGGDELAARVASVKMLRAVAQAPDAAQFSVPLDDLVAFLKDKVNEYCLYRWWAGWVVFWRINESALAGACNYCSRA